MCLYVRHFITSPAPPILNVTQVIMLSSTLNVTRLPTDAFKGKPTLTLNSLISLDSVC